MQTTNAKQLQGAATVKRLLQIARREFQRNGYAQTTTQSILDKAGITKGALYHHFASKGDLFEAVYRDVEEEMALRIQQASGKRRDPFKQLVAGCNAYLETCADSSLYRILRLDGPAALGQKKWQEIDREYGVKRLLPFLQAMKAEKVLQVTSVEAFAYQLTGAMNEATFWIAEHEKPDIALRDAKKVLLQLLTAFRLPVK